MKVDINIVKSESKSKSGFTLSGTARPPEKRRLAIRIRDGPSQGPNPGPGLKQLGKNLQTAYIYIMYIYFLYFLPSWQPHALAGPLRLQPACFAIGSPGRRYSKVQANSQPKNHRTKKRWSMQSFSIMCCYIYNSYFWELILLCVFHFNNFYT